MLAALVISYFKIAKAEKIIVGKTYLSQYCARRPTEVLARDEYRSENAK